MTGILGKVTAQLFIFTLLQKGLHHQNMIVHVVADTLVGLQLIRQNPQHRLVRLTKKLFCLLTVPHLKPAADRKHSITNRNQQQQHHQRYSQMNQRWKFQIPSLGTKENAKNSDKRKHGCCGAVGNFRATHPAEKQRQADQQDGVEQREKLLQHKILHPVDESDSHA